jgi:hypothetical protein
MATALEILRRMQEPQRPRAKRVRRGLKPEAQPEDATRLRRIKAGVPLDIDAPSVDIALECLGDLGVTFVEHKSLKEPEAPTQLSIFTPLEVETE